MYQLQRDSEAPTLWDAPYDGVLATKLAPAPSRPLLLPRVHLIAQLEQADQAAQAALTLVVAPAGAGKTTLVAQWCRQTQQLTAWVTLDAADTDPVRFWRHVIVALQTIAAPLGIAMLAQLPTLSTRPFAPALTSLVNDLAACLHDIVLILDDYHLITTPAIHEALTFLLDHRSTHFHLLIASRATPPLPIARLRARGQLHELAAVDLRLTAPEALVLMQDLLGLPLAAADVLTLAARTEGWITGMHLAALALRDQPDPSGLLATFRGAQRSIADYLLAEVVDHQTAAMQAFLLQTALLDRLSAPLCDAVTGGTTSGAWLDAVERANLFLTPLDAAGRTYRYHDLFAEALRTRIWREQPDLARTVHRRAAAWYVAEGMAADAIPHLFAIGAFDQAADLLAQLADPLLLCGEVATILNWLNMLPDARIQARLPLIQARIFAQMATGQIALLDADITALAALPGKGDTTAALQVLAAMLYDADPRVQAQLQQALIAPAGVLPTDQDAPLYQGFAHWASGAVAPARTALTLALHAYQRSGAADGEVFVTGLLAEIAIQEGALHQAAQLYGRAQQLLSRAADRATAVAGPPAIGLGILYYEWNNLERAQALIAQGLQLATRGGRVDVVLSGLLARARVQQAMGDLAGATAAYAEVVQTARVTRTPRLIAYDEAQQAADWLRQGAVAEALAWARTQRMVVDDPIRYLRELEYVTYACVLALQGADDAALALLARLKAQTRAAGRHGQTLVVLLATAQVQQAHGDATAAGATVRQALMLAAPGSYLRTFVDVGPALAPALAAACDQLAHAAPSAGIDIRAYALRVRAACAAAWPAESVHAKRVSAAPEPRLSPRERELLDGLAAGWSDKEIAQRLGLTAKTVRWYATRLYAKLGVHSRMQAVASARRLGLVT